MSNPRISGLLKVGFTCSNVEKRRRELSSATGVPTEFVVEYFQLSDDVEDIEGVVHSELESYRVGNNKEFFQASINIVVAAIERHVRRPAMQFQRFDSDVGERSRKFSCHRCGFQYTKASALELCPSCGF
jgi:rubrerythrin